MTLTTIITILAVLLAITRRLAPHLTRWLSLPVVPPKYARWAWLPAAIVAALALASTRLGEILGIAPEVPGSWQQVVEVVDTLIQVGILVEGFAARGHLSPVETAVLRSLAPPAGDVPVHFVIPPISMVLLVVLVAGCSPSLARSHELGQASRAVGAGAGATTDEERCGRLSRAEHALRYVSVGAGTLSGGVGLATIPADDPEAERALAISAAGLAVVAVTAEAVRSEVAGDWAEECQ